MLELIAETGHIAGTEPAVGDGVAGAAMSAAAVVAGCVTAGFG